MAKLCYLTVLCLFLVCVHLTHSMNPKNQDHAQTPINSPHVLASKKSDLNDQSASLGNAYKQKTLSNEIFKPHSAKAISFLNEARQSHLDPLSSLNSANILDSESSSSSVDLQQQMEDMQAKVDGNIVKMQKNLEKAFKQSVVEMDRSIEKATSKLVREIQNDTDTLNQTMTEQTTFLHEQIHNDTVNLGAQIQTTDNDVNEGIDYTQDLTMIILSSQIDDKEAQFQKLNDKIAELKNEMPPPPSVCVMYSDCTTCTSNSQCGWCADSSSCVPGDSVGPLNTYCNFYNFQLCSGTGCVLYNDCSSCLSDPFCGWCNAPDMGVTQCLESPVSTSGCPTTNWFGAGGTAQCPVTSVSVGVPANTPPSASGTDSELPLEIEKIQAMQEELNKYEVEAQNVASEILSLKAQLQNIKNEQLERKTEAEKVKLQEQQNVQAQLAAANASYHDKPNNTASSNATNTTNNTNTTNSPPPTTIKAETGSETSTSSETTTATTQPTTHTAAETTTTTYTALTATTAKPIVSTVATTSTAQTKTVGTTTTVAKTNTGTQTTTAVETTTGSGTKTAAETGTSADKTASTTNTASTIHTTTTAHAGTSS